MKVIYERGDGEGIYINVPFENLTGGPLAFTFRVNSNIFRILSSYESNTYTETEKHVYKHTLFCTL